MGLSAGARRISGRLLAAALVFGLFVLFDIALFGWLIVRSLSQRELEKILLETRVEAEGLATRIAGRAQDEGKDLYTAIALERETQTYIDSVLKQRDIVQTVEIRDNNGLLVFRSSAKATIPSLSPPAAATPEHRAVPPQIEHKTFEHESTYDVTVPIADLGMLRIGISRGELEQRIGRLRGELVQETLLIGAVTLGLLLSAYLAIWWLWRRGQRLEEQAREAERMAYVGTLASGLAHEIRNPLNSLSLNMQMLEEEEDGNASPPGSRRTLLALTRSEIQRLERLVGDFLAYARPRPLELEEVSAARLLHHARELLHGEARAAGVELAVEDDCGGAEVRVDRAQIGQLLLNLAQNALAATERSEPPRRVRLACRREGPRVVLEVGDNGVGIEASQQARIFDLFYSTRKGGTGLGLAIVRRIAQAHQGTVDVWSAPGAGTTVAVSLPAAGVPREARAPRPTAEGVAS
ncbi:MAG TPA: ATP-binding protein [Thermoanaerobaculia bacterium]|nr:ATP-binding protein [Thermoanaerobaculia bacterium]